MKSVFACLLATTVLAGLAQAQPATSGVEVEAPWARATAPGGSTGAAYATLQAPGTGDDRLTGVSTPVAGMVELHRTTMENGVMRMRPVEGGLALPAGKPVTLSPSGLHLMLMGLKQPLKQGESFPLTLSFAHAAPVTVQVPVQGPGASGPEAAGHAGMSHMGGTTTGGQPAGKP